MNDIWAPWRIEYINEPKTSGCIFCTATEKNDPLILKRGSTCFAIMNRYPYTGGHCMVVPYRHTADLSSLSVEETIELMSMVNEIMQAMRETMKTHGFNVGCNIGAVAGAGITDHFHMHVVPRWMGDTNFMPVLGDTHVISEHIMKTRDKIAGKLP